jgi:ElaB/YqjD/DUF883 family membrane-anchored ribosome-binding protein
MKKSDPRSERKPSAGEPIRDDFERLRRDVAKLTQKVGELTQKQAASAREEAAGSLGAASEQIAQSASAAQEKMTSLEADLEIYVRRKPLHSVLVALGIGFLLGKISS